MSQLSDELTQVKSDIKEGTTELLKKITDLEASIPTDTLSAESRALLDEIKADAATLASIVKNPEPPVA